MNTKTVFILIAGLVAAQIFAMGSAFAQTVNCRIVQSTSDLAYEQVIASASIEIIPGESQTIRDNATQIAATITGSEEGRYTMALYHPSEGGLEPVSFSYASTANSAVLNNTQKQIGITCSKAF